MKMSGLNEMTSTKENEEDVNKDEREYKTMNRILHLLLKKLTSVKKKLTIIYVKEKLCKKKKGIQVGKNKKRDQHFERRGTCAYTSIISHSLEGKMKAIYFIME
jgi:hypothetical protein